MTAAYTDDSTIVQEQKQEKKIAVSPTNSPSSNKDRTTQDEIENRTERSMIILKDSTGGQDKEEISQDQEKCTIISVTIDSISSSEQETLEDHEDLENGQASQTNLLETTPNNDSIIESKSDEAADHDINTPVKSVIRGTSPEIQEDIVEENCRNVASSTCAADSSPSRSTNLKSAEESEDASRMQLNELRYLLENVVSESKNHSTDKYDLRKTYGVEENSISRDGAEEIYDPESELDFHEAVRAGDAKCVAALLMSGSVQNLDEPDWNVSGDPPLLVAATNHCLPVLSLLLANGCDPAVRSPRGETALHRVILNGGPGNVLKFVGELLKYDCPPGVKEAGGGLTALHVLTRQLAHAQGSKNLHHNFDTAIKTLELLAQAGPINAKDHQGRSALHILTSSTIFDNNHRTEIESLIETLLAAGADPSLKNDRGETPLHECLECGALNTAFLLIPHTPTGVTSRYGETPLHIASRKNYVDMVAKLLEHGEDPSVQDAGGNTPLHLASARGFHQTVSLLVTSPLAQLEKLNIEGLTALQVAAESGFVNAVRLLLKAGADPSQTIHYCATTLHRHPDISVLINHELTRRRQLAA